MRTVKKISLVLSIVILLMAASAFVAPGFLLYTTPCGKSDAIVLLLGPDFTARHRHARDLMQKGMADHLIIPAYGKTYLMDQGTIKNITNKTDKKPSNGENNSHKPIYYEDTHLELLDAKKTMDFYGQKTAIFVSSPYHMRRIRLIVSKVFGNRNMHSFSPTPYEAASENFWQMKPADWKKVWREYLKISWFMIYSNWS